MNFFNAEQQAPSKKLKTSKLEVKHMHLQETIGKIFIIKIPYFFETITKRKLLKIQINFYFRNLKANFKQSKMIMKKRFKCNFLLISRYAEDIHNILILDIKLLMILLKTINWIWKQ